MTVARRKDNYGRFADLQRAERQDVDYRIRFRRGTVSVAIIAPHGGKIEAGTSELAEAIAGDNYSFYCFEGLKTHDNHRLHLTSTHFDEPTGVALVAASDYVVAIHGWGSKQPLIYMGGLDDILKTRIDGALVSAGFRSESSGRVHLQGMSPKNLCNRGRRGKGAQLEISAMLRADLTRSGKRQLLVTFVSAVRHAISDVAGA
jgi:phage replication-related protein YjqB (UPF0714/DUF867 family)